MKTPVVVPGNVLKATIGTYYQVFNESGILIESKFIAGDECNYTDSEGNSIDCNYYHPFDTANREDASRTS